MVSFKLCISDPSSGKTFQKEVKDSAAQPFIGLNIGETMNGDSIEIAGYEFQITGGSDYCGFPMRKGILGLRKKISIYGGVGFRGSEKGTKKRKTVCGHKIHERISQINLKVIKQGSEKLNEIFGVPETTKEEKTEGEPIKEGKRQKEHKSEEKKEVVKEQKTEEKLQEKAVKEILRLKSIAHKLLKKDKLF